MAVAAANAYDGARHRQWFGEFFDAKRLVGEPSPHMTLVGWMSRNEEPAEKKWRAGCYLVPYSVMSAEAIWQTWPYQAAVADPDGLSAWVRDHWDGMHTRTERRTVRTPERFAKSLNGYAAWLRDRERETRWTAPPDQAGRYDHWWASANEIPYFGRYIVIRLLEYFRRYADSKTELYDIRSIGGWSPIKALMLLHPEETPALSTGQHEHVDRVARRVMADYRTSGLDMGYYAFAALLCEYRVAWENHAQYPGWTIDQELEYQRGHHATYWQARGFHTQLWEARAALFPVETLGERSGAWDGRRKDCAALLRDHGLVWSDVRWNYAASRDDLAHPVEWT